MGKIQSANAFITSDGKKFLSLSKAEEYQKNLDEAERLSDLLGGTNIKDDGCNFANGDGYYLLNTKKVELFIRDFSAWALQNVYGKDFKGPADPIIICRSGYLGRYLSDGDSPFCRPHSIFSSVILKAERWRRYGQPYFANHPEKAKNICLGELN